jgi:hypothetical protein
MGCGCKNKGNQTPPAPAPSAQQTQTQSQRVNVQEDVKTAIKKTVEKYYSKKNTNGWVRE